jgi:hypothetical protein
LTAFPVGRSEAIVLVALNVPFDLYVAANFFRIFVGIPL